MVIILFGIMAGGAALGYVLDARARKRTIERMKAPEAGFSAVPGDPDCWVWRLQLDELNDELDAPSGTAVVLSEIMGLPFARLRAALPDELLGTPLSAALGRKQAFSLSGMVSVRMQQTSKRLSTRGASLSKVAAGDDEDTEAAAVTTEASGDAAVRLEEMVGTALMLGFLQAACLMHVVELAKRRSAANRHFHGVLTPNGRGFDTLCTDFVTMMSPGACMPACKQPCFKLLTAYSQATSTPAASGCHACACGSSSSARTLMAAGLHALARRSRWRHVPRRRRQT